MAIDLTSAEYQAGRHALSAELRAVLDERDAERAELVRLLAAEDLGLHGMGLVDALRNLAGKYRAERGQRLMLSTAQVERDEVRRAVLAVAEDLEAYAADVRPEKLPMSQRKLAGVLRSIVEGNHG